MKHTVLIFDDDAEILQICAIILESKGFRVVTENSCEDVTGKVIRSGADVVLMDNSIPYIGGIEATRIVKQHESTKHIPVIFFSANSHVASLSQQAGADYYLPKPFDISKLEEMVSRAIGKLSQTVS
jgi:CheY-like chemotaxis protein